VAEEYKDVFRLHQTELDAIEDEDKKYERLTELNVQEHGVAPGQNLHYSTCMEKQAGPRFTWLGIWFKRWYNSSCI
jgi:hypothetical protein